VDRGEDRRRSVPANALARSERRAESLNRRRVTVAGSVAGLTIAAVIASWTSDLPRHASDRIKEAVRGGVPRLAGGFMGV
jgi:hypothetical protein